jgi:hypothetical protein
MKRLVTFPYSFVLMNWAAVVALYYFTTGRKKDVWLKYKLTHTHSR